MRSAPRPGRLVQQPPKAGALKVRRDLIGGTLLRRFYDRGDLPMSVEHSPGENRIKWKVEIEKLDYHYYLPILADGLRERDGAVCAGPPISRWAQSRTRSLRERASWT